MKHVKHRDLLIVERAAFYLMEPQGFTEKRFLTLDLRQLS